MNKVRIVSITAPLIPECENAEQLVAFCARVSNPANQANVETAPKLLNYCAKNAHWSVFEMVNVTVEITATRDISRQILRHKSNAFQEFSQRYSDEIEFNEPKEARLQDKKNRQNSLPLNNDLLQYEWQCRQLNAIEIARRAYDWALENGIAKECARVVLPEGLTLTTMYVNFTLRSLIHYLQVRLDPSTQKEHREVAQMILDAVQPHFPTLDLASL